MNADLLSVISEPLHNSLDLEHNAHDATRINANDDNEMLRYCRGCLPYTEVNRHTSGTVKYSGIAETSSAADEKGTRARVGVCSCLLRKDSRSKLPYVSVPRVHKVGTTRYSTCTTRRSCGPSASCPAILHVSRPFSSVHRVRSTCQQHSESSHAFDSID